MSREFHPIADIFPLLLPERLDELAADIRAHGLHEPIWLHPDGRIIDGRNRYLACGRVGVEPATRTWSGTEADLVPFVVSLNLHRRHLNESQRAMVASRIATLDAHRPQGSAAIAVVTQPAAAAADVASLPQAEQVEVIAKGAAEIIRKAKEIKETRRAVKKAERAERFVQAAAEPVQPAPGPSPVTVICADSTSMPLDDESIHLVITSPPYNVGVDYRAYEDTKTLGEYLAMLRAVLCECSRVLVPGGLFLPCRGWISTIPDRHVTHAEARSLRRCHAEGGH